MTTTRWWSWGLLAAVVGCWFFLGSRIDSLERSHREELDALRADMDLLEQRLTSDLAGGGTDLRNPQRISAGLAALRSGLYVVDLKVPVWNAARSARISQEVTLYHVRQVISGGRALYAINLGLAVSGLLTVPLFYIDYNRDGNIDLDMMQDFAALLPGGRLLARAVDARKAQYIYDAFLSDVSRARFYSSAHIAESGSAVSTELWQFVESQSGALAAWIEGRPTRVPGATGGGG